MMNLKYDCANFSLKDLSILRFHLKEFIEIKRQNDLTMDTQQAKPIFKEMVPSTQHILFYMTEHSISEDRENSFR